VNLRHVRDSTTGERQWEFPCECGHKDCYESVFLTLDAYAALSVRGDVVLADGHRVSQIARARRLVHAASALRAQAEQQIWRTRKKLDES
jgi:hypothetical protein